MTLNRESRWFGFEKVSPTRKTRMVGDVFSSVADNYDLMNDLMSGGIHRLWKRKCVNMMRPSTQKRLLDVAGGTGDIAFRYRAAAGDGADITVCDINPDMLRVGRERAIDRGYLSGIDWVEGNAESLPFADSSFDIYSISFGLRNVTHIDNALHEARRVLKPGGQFFCMEFSEINNKALKKAYDVYSFSVIPRIGEIVTKDRKSYEYLVESIRQFPKAGDLARRMKTAGFDHVTWHPLSAGIATIHVGNVY